MNLPVIAYWLLDLVAPPPSKRSVCPKPCALESGKVKIRQEAVTFSLSEGLSFEPPSFGGVHPPFCLPVQFQLWEWNVWERD